MSQADQKIKIKEVDFRKIFDTYFPSLCVFASRLLKDENLAKDIVQEVFVRIWKNIEEFESEKSMKVYFYISTKNACFDHLKKERRKGISQEIKEAIQIEDDFVMNEIIREETYRQLEEAIQILPPKARQVMLMNLNGLSNQEIAEELNVSLNTIKTHKLTAYRKIREMFGKEFVIFLLVEFYHFLK